MAAPSSPLSQVAPDGFRCDVEGDLWCGWGMGDAAAGRVQISIPVGRPIGFIALSAAPTSAFGGARRDHLSWRRPFALLALREQQGAPGG